MESFNTILDSLQDIQLDIDLFEMNSDVNAPSFPLSHKINRLKDDEIINNDLIILYKNIIILSFMITLLTTFLYLYVSKYKYKIEYINGVLKNNNNDILLYLT